MSVNPYDPPANPYEAPKAELGVPVNGPDLDRLASGQWLINQAILINVLYWCLAIAVSRMPNRPGGPSIAFLIYTLSMMIILLMSTAGGV